MTNYQESRSIEIWIQVNYIIDEGWQCVDYIKNDSEGLLDDNHFSNLTLCFWRRALNLKFSCDSYIFSPSICIMSLVRSFILPIISLNRFSLSLISFFKAAISLFWSFSSEEWDNYIYLCINFDVSYLISICWEVIFLSASLKAIFW